MKLPISDRLLACCNFVCPGDRVVLMGTDGNLTISAEELGAAANSFNYEQICDISRRVTRVYYKNGQIVHTLNYLLNK
jgi:alanine racemase